MISNKQLQRKTNQNNASHSGTQHQLLLAMKSQHSVSSLQIFPGCKGCMHQHKVEISSSSHLPILQDTFLLWQQPSHWNPWKLSVGNEKFATFIPTITLHTTKTFKTKALSHIQSKSCLIL
jgi:hypothetical protein